jgi:DNA-binding MarR family transcriptional regulator
MGTILRDEGAMLKVLERRTEGIRSTDLFLAVRGTVRSPTTFQKRLKHLLDKGRIRIKDDLDDMRAKIITSTPKSEEASRVLEAIDLLERLYLGKPPKKTVKVTQFRDGQPSETEKQQNAALILLELAYKAYMKLYGMAGFEDGVPETEACIWIHQGPLGFVGGEDEDPGIQIGAWEKSFLKEVFEGRQRLAAVQGAIMKSAELTRLMESKGFVVDEDGVRKRVEEK